MSYENGLIDGGKKELDLGVVICKRCNEVIATIPTNGTRKIYGECKEGACNPKVLPKAN